MTAKETAFIDVVFDGPPSHKPAGFVEVEDATGKSVRVGEWLDRPDGLVALRLPLQRGTHALREAGPAIENLRNHQRQLDGDGTEVGVSRQALTETLDAFKTVLQAIDDRARIIWEGENVAYSDVMRQATSYASAISAEYPEGAHHVRQFVERFEHRAGLTIPATSQKA